MSRVSDKLKNVKIPQSKKRSEPLWRGPEEDGITYSLLCRFLNCRERFRLRVVEGLEPAPQFHAPMEYGQMWHICEEAWATGQGGYCYDGPLMEYAKILCRKYPLQQEQVDHWYQFCKATFPIYVNYWRKNPDVVNRTPLLQEQQFNVPYKLPSGRIVRLRGKWDSVDLIGQGKQAGIYIQENKTKSQIDERKVTRQLSFDLQTMIYMVALTEWQNDPKSGPQDLWNFKIRGVRYNVIRRSAHKSVESMMKKLNEDLADNRGGEWFARWKVEITANDIVKFRRECLDPILEQLCDWWDHLTYEPVHPSNKAQYRGRELRGDPFQSGEDSDGNYHSPPHWRHPYGVYNVLDEGGSSDLDAYLETGSEVGLVRTDNLFPELS